MVTAKGSIRELQLARILAKYQLLSRNQQQVFLSGLS